MTDRQRHAATSPKTLEHTQAQGSLNPVPGGTTRRSAMALALGLAGAVAVSASPAFAHSRLIKSDPSARAVLAAAPKEVKLWFNEEVEPAFAKIWLAPEKGEKIALASRGDPSDKNLLIATLPESVPEGPVVIAFRVLSVDGHVIESQLIFTVKKSA
jgi:methionine-rich copper-binding protein CopC